MGFKYKKFTLTGGDSDFPTGNTDALRLERSQSVLKNAADNLILTDTGWALDTGRNATTESFSSVPCLSGAKTYPGLFFRNSISGCKLFMAYFGGSYADTDIISNFGSNDNLYYLSNTTAISGLIISIIPKDSSSEFGASFDNSFLPADATRLCGTCFYDSRSSSYSPAHASNPTSGQVYTWGILATPYAVGVASSQSTNSSSPVYVTGKIFGVLAHKEDNAVNSRYGTVFFRYRTSTDPEGWSGDIFNSITPLSGSAIKVCGVSESVSGYNTTTCCGIFAKSDGTWINGTNQSSYIVLLITATPWMLSGYTFDRANETRWVPLYMLVKTSDLSTYNVINGDGVKGFLDTDLFRCGLGEFGKLFEGGNFIKANSAEFNNLILGWSPQGNDEY